MMDILDGCAHGAAEHFTVGHQRQRQAVHHRIFRRRPRRHGDAARDAGRRRQRDRRGARCRARMRWKPSATRLLRRRRIWVRPYSRRSWPTATSMPTATSTAATESHLLDVLPGCRNAAAERHADRHDFCRGDCCRKPRCSTSTTPVVAIPGEPALSAELTALLAVPPHSRPADESADADVPAGLRQSLSHQQRVSRELRGGCRDRIRTALCRRRRRASPLAKVKPTFGLRQDFYVNDMRNGAWAPKAPTLLCGGDQDPTVYLQRQHRDHGRILERAAGRAS